LLKRDNIPTTKKEIVKLCKQVDQLRVKKNMGEEMGTDTNADKADDTKMNKFCRKHGINPNLIMLKITLFVMYGGKLMEI
jgi:hypothetical protein